MEALGGERARRVEAGVERLAALADAAPQYTCGVVHLPIPLTAPVPDAAEVELLRLLHSADPEVPWTYTTRVTDDGRIVGKASPFLRQSAPLDSPDWLVTFALSDLYTRIGSWWLTQLWRGAELAVAARDAIERWNPLVAAACARSLLEGAALSTEVPKLIGVWDAYKRAGRPTTGSLAEFMDRLNGDVLHLQYATRVGQGQGRPPKVPSTHVMTYLAKLAKRTPDFDVVDVYEWLCDAVHPSYGSSTTYTVVRAVDPARSHQFEQYARHPLRPTVSNPRTVTPTVARKAADAVVLASDPAGPGRRALGAGRPRADDGDRRVPAAGLPARPPAPERNAPCPCGSGRKFKRCVHRWGQPGPMPTSP
ncbi:SEC-C domain-containing protein [Streptomyces sp. HMX112]|uniref:SEC-C domain-containing protein n=1 Tax=Streptomyces sp. HMX112 TaxID=3390850 RepID=UPI003A7FAE2A